MTSLSVFFPLRAGSTRVLRKNTRPFDKDGRSLFQRKLAQIERCADRFDELIVSTNDTEIMEQFAAADLPEHFKLVERPDELGRSDTKVQDLIDYVPTVTQGDWIFWLHATSPFIDETDYLKALDMLDREVLSGEKDSLMSVNKIQQFLWDDNQRKVINTDRSVNPWPNTQDLAPLYEINHAFYINSRSNYHTLRDRIGQAPALYLCEGAKKIDIDWQDDFDLAQALNDAMVQSNG